jgi:hypothetical protein
MVPCTRQSKSESDCIVLWGLFGKEIRLDWHMQKTAKFACRKNVGVEDIGGESGLCWFLCISFS